MRGALKAWRVLLKLATAVYGPAKGPTSGTINPGPDLHTFNTSTIYHVLDSFVVVHPIRNMTSTRQAASRI